MTIAAGIWLSRGYEGGSWSAWVKFKLGVASAPTVIQGKDGWLFAAVDPNDSEDFALDSWTIALRQRHAWLKRRNIRYIFILAPIKENIYPEQLPDKLRNVRDTRRARQLLDALKKAGVEAVYLRDDVFRARNEGLVFYKYDPHWNRFGAYAGARSMLGRLANDYPAIGAPLANVKRFVLQERPRAKNMWNNDLNFGNHLGLTLLEADPEPVPVAGWTTRMESAAFGKHSAHVFTKNEPSLPTLVMFGDSFMFGMMRPMAEGFRRAVFVNPWLESPSPAEQFPAEVVEKETPDLVLEQRWEPGIRPPTGNPPMVTQ